MFDDTIFLATMLTLVVVLALTCYTELKDNLIPNKITYTGMVLGLVYGFLPGGIDLQSSAVGLTLGFGTLFIFYIFGGMGGGDVKLMGTVGALLGVQHIVAVLIYTSLIGAVMAIFYLTWNKKLLEGLARSMRLLISRRKKNKPTDETDPEHADLGGIPYGLAIATGTLVALWTVK
jgi:prepilin peptidase CpaA